MFRNLKEKKIGGSPCLLLVMVVLRPSSRRALEGREPCTPRACSQDTESNTSKLASEWNHRSSNYSRTSLQRPPWGQRWVAVVKRWPLWGGRDAARHHFWGKRLKVIIFQNAYCSISGAPNENILAKYLKCHFLLSFWEVAVVERWPLVEVRPN